MQENKILPYFNIYASDLKTFKDKINADRLFYILDCISDYCLYAEYDFKSQSKFEDLFFNKILDNILKSQSKYNASVNNGKKGGRPIVNKNNPQVNPVDNLDITQQKPIEENRIEKNIKEEKRRKEDIDIKETQNKKLLVKKTFEAPSKQEILEYAKTRSREDLVDKFFNYYDGTGWKDKENKQVKNWKAKFLTWENNNKAPTSNVDNNIDYALQNTMEALNSIK